jgi:hypothetical protein
LIADAHESDMDAQSTGTIKLRFIGSPSCEQLAGSYRADEYLN